MLLLFSFYKASFLTFSCVLFQFLAFTRRNTATNMGIFGEKQLKALV